MIIASGFNVYPRDIEEVLYEHSHIKEAVVIGVPHPYRGETIKAILVVKEGNLFPKKSLLLIVDSTLRLTKFRESLSFALSFLRPM